MAFVLSLDYSTVQLKPGASYQTDSCRPRLLFTCSVHVRHYTDQRMRADKVLLAVDVI